MTKACAHAINDGVSVIVGMWKDMGSSAHDTDLALADMATLAAAGFTTFDLADHYAMQSLRVDGDSMIVVTGSLAIRSEPVAAHRLHGVEDARSENTAASVAAPDDCLHGRGREHMQRRCRPRAPVPEYLGNLPRANRPGVVG